MSRAKAWWRGLSKRWRLVIIIVPAIVIVGLGGAAGAVGVSGYSAKEPSACGKCHVMQPYVDSYYESGFIDSVHARAERDVKCKDCHYVTPLQQVQQIIAFVTGSYDIPLKQNVQAQRFCTGCHPEEEIDAAVRNDRPELVENPLVSYHFTVEGNKTGCRDPRVEVVRCQDCHRVHRAGVNYCTTCHSSSFSAPDK